MQKSFSIFFSVTVHSHVPCAPQGTHVLLILMHQPKSLLRQTPNIQAFVPCNRSESSTVVQAVVLCIWNLSQPEHSLCAGFGLFVLKFNSGERTRWQGRMGHRQVWGEQSLKTQRKDSQLQPRKQPGTHLSLTALRGDQSFDTLFMDQQANTLSSLELIESYYLCKGRPWSFIFAVLVLMPFTDLI